MDARRLDYFGPVHELERHADGYPPPFSVVESRRTMRPSAGLKPRPRDLPQRTGISGTP